MDRQTLPKRAIPYICDSIIMVECSLIRCTFNPRSKVTDIGYLLSWKADFGWIRFELNSGCGDLGMEVEVFDLLSAASLMFNLFVPH